MPDPTHLLLPPEIVVRFTTAMSGAEEELAASRVERAEARAEREAFRRDFMPILEEWATETRARRDARARSDADRMEGLAAWRRLLYSRATIGVVGTLLGILATYLLGSAGIAPAVVSDALQIPIPAQDAPEDPHAAVPGPVPPAPRPARASTTGAGDAE